MTCIAAKIVSGGKRVRWAWESRTTLSSDGFAVAESVPKVVEVDGWGPIGGAGGSANIISGIELFRGSHDLGRVAGYIARIPDADADWMLFADGGLVVVDTDGATTRPALKFWAIGMGAQLAIGAMAAGASAYRAVAISCELHSTCGGPIHTLDWMVE